VRSIAVALLAAVLVACAVDETAWRDCVHCPELVRVPAGEFMMGSTRSETEQHAVKREHAVVEWPQHKVTIDYDFLIGRFEVSKAQYREFVEATARESSECLEYNGKRYEPVAGSGWDNPPFRQQDDHPAICVSWDDATAYTEWLSERTGEHYRLPSEAEWEYAARAGSAAARHWNEVDGDACAHANVADRNAPRPKFECADPYAYTAPVSYGIENKFGLVGVLGNVGELVADCGLPDYAQASGSAVAVTTGDCTRHVGRGGSWWNDAYYLRSARRYSFAGAYSIVGFRVVRELQAKPE